MNNTYDDFYNATEQRITTVPRRLRQSRRHRTRTESLVSDCRTLFSRRKEDEEGFFDAYITSEDERLFPSGAQPQIEK